MEEPIFVCNSDPHHLVASFVEDLKNLACQSREKLKNLFSDIKTTNKIKLGSILEKLTQRDNRREKVSVDEYDNNSCASTQFLQIKKNLVKSLPERLERCFKILPVFDFDRAIDDLILINSYL